MKRVNTKPKKANQRQQKEPFEIVMDTNYFNLSILLLVLHGGFGFGKKRLNEVIDGYLALVQEVSDRRGMVKDVIAECRKRTGFDTRELLTYALAGDYEAWRRKLGKCK